MDTKIRFTLAASSVVLSFVFALFASQFLVSFHFEFELFYFVQALKAMLYLAVLFYLWFFVNGQVIKIFKHRLSETFMFSFVGLAAVLAFSQFYYADAELSRQLTLYSSPLYLLFGVFVYVLGGLRVNWSLLPLWLLVSIVIGFSFYSLSWNVNFYSFSSQSALTHCLIIAISSLLITISLRLFYEKFEQGYELNLMPMVLGFSLLCEMYGREGFVVWWSAVVFHIALIYLTLVAINRLNTSTSKILDMYRQGLNDTTSVFCSGRSDGSLVFANQAFKTLFGWSAKTHVSQLKHPFVEHPLWAEMLDECLRNGEWRGETVIANNRGKVIAVYVEMTQLARQPSWHQISIVDKQDTVELKRKKEDVQEKLERLSFNLMEKQEEERRFFAKELHDEIGQGLTLLKIQQQLPEPDNQLIKNVLTELIDKVRNMSLNLRPAILDDMGLSAALTWLAGRQKQFSQLAIKVSIPGSLPRFDDKLEISVFRIAQEAFTNIHKYSHATEALIKCEMDSESLRLTIADNGVGFDVDAKFNDAVQSQSLGLVSIKERAHLISAEINIFSTPESGTRIEVKVPLNNTEVVND